MAALCTLKNLQSLTRDCYLPSEGWKETKLGGEMNSQNSAAFKLKGHFQYLKKLQCYCKKMNQLLKEQKTG